MITPEKRASILKRLKAVGTAEMCRRAGVKRRILYAVLNNESSRLEVVKMVLAEAAKEVKSRNKKLKSL